MSCDLPYLLSSSLVRLKYVALAVSWNPSTNVCGVLVKGRCSKQFAQLRSCVIGRSPLLSHQEEIILVSSSLVARYIMIFFGNILAR